MAVVSCRNKNDLRQVLLCNALQEFAQKEGVLLVTEMAVHRDVDIIAEPLCIAYFGNITRERENIILVDGDEQNLVRVVEGFLGPIAVMNVEIDDQNSIELEVILEILCGNGNIVEDTKSHASARFCMMAWRANKGKSLFEAAAHNLISKFQATAGRKLGCCKGKLHEVRVFVVGERIALDGMFANLIKVKI